MEVLCGISSNIIGVKCLLRVKSDSRTDMYRTLTSDKRGEITPCDLNNLFTDLPDSDEMIHFLYSSNQPTNHEE